MAAPVILGCDPGGSETGLVVCRGDVLLAHDVVRRTTKITPKAALDLAYLQEVITAAAALINSEEVKGVIDALAIEAVNAPNPHLGMTNAAGAIATGAVVGALVGWNIAAYDKLPVLYIETGAHGMANLRTYPHALQPTRGEGKGTDILRHARSAFDIALAARFYLRTGQGAT